MSAFFALGIIFLLALIIGSTVRVLHRVRLLLVEFHFLRRSRLYNYPSRQAGEGHHSLWVGFGWVNDRGAGIFSGCQLTY